MAKMRIKKGDLVQVISGRSQKTGRGVRTGGIMIQEAAIHVSNVAVVDPETKTPTRIRTRVDIGERDGRQKATRTRVSVRSGKDLS